MTSRGTSQPQLLCNSKYSHCFTEKEWRQKDQLKMLIILDAQTVIYIFRIESITHSKKTNHGWLHSCECSTFLATNNSSLKSGTLKIGHLYSYGGILKNTNESRLKHA